MKFFGWFSHFSLFLVLLTAQNVHGACKQIRVGVVDTGLNLQDPRFTSHLCPTGHKNFVPNESIKDIHGHGSHVAGLIKKFAGKANYCLLIYKYYSKNATGQQNLDREVQAFNEAVANHADVVNFSGGGREPNEDEYNLIRNHPKTIFVVAAGNEHQDLDIPGNEYYPASYNLPNQFVIGAHGADGQRLPSANWSKRVIESELGEDVVSTLPDGQEGAMSGTSMATGIFSGKLVDTVSKTCED